MLNLGISEFLELKKLDFMWAVAFRKCLHNNTMKEEKGRVKAWKRSKIDFQPYVYYNNSQGVFVAMICLSKVLAAYTAHT